MKFSIFTGGKKYLYIAWASFRNEPATNALFHSQVRHHYGSQDTVTTVEDREVRHCNWVRFLKYSPTPSDVNLVGIKVKDEVVFQTVKTILPNEEIVAYLRDPNDETEHEAALPETATGNGYFSIRETGMTKLFLSKRPINSNRPFGQ